MTLSCKFLLPTFLNRFSFIESRLSLLAKHKNILSLNILHIGCGEGDYDFMISRYCAQLISTDINQDDINRANIKNKSIENIKYIVDDATSLSFGSNSFDIVVSVDVLEHTADPESFLKEIKRVLKPGGVALITFPNQRFPITYDPINWLLDKFNLRVNGIGAYAFGHNWLPSKNHVARQISQVGLHKISSTILSKSIVGLIEMYWVGLLQRVIKPNSTNTMSTSEHVQILTRYNDHSIKNTGQIAIKLMLFLTYCICFVDKIFGLFARDGINTGLILEKQSIKCLSTF